MSRHKVERPEILEENELKLQQGQELVDAIATANRSLSAENQILTGNDAREKAGLPLEWAADVALTTDATDTFFSIRAPNPLSLPRYNLESSPKGSDITTKSGQSGFAKGVIPLEIAETRRKNGVPLGHHKDDSEHLALPVHHPAHLHCITHKVTMQDIIRELQDDGDLVFEKYEHGILTLKYKDGRDLEYILDLNETSNAAPLHWSRPEDEALLEARPKSLEFLSEEIYSKLAGKAFEVNYRIGDSDIKPYKVFANKPKTVNELIRAVIKSDGIWDEEDKQFKIEKLEAQQGRVIADMEDLFSEHELEQLYDQSSKVITGDQDGLILGIPLDLPEEFSEVFNTFNNRESTRASEKGTTLIARSKKFFAYLQEKLQEKYGNEREKLEGNNGNEIKEELKENNDNESTANTPKLYQALKGKKFDDLGIDSSIIARAGCITAQEFIFAQILNSLHKNPITPLGESYNMQTLQQIFDKSLKAIFEGMQHNDAEVAFNNSIQLADKLLDEATIPKNKLEKAAIPKNQSEKLKKFLHYHINAAFLEHALPENYLLPFPDYDPNVHNLIQHGFDTRNPKGCNFEGPTIIFWRGQMAYCPTQEVLAKLIIDSNLYKYNLLPINHAVDMNAGWGKVIASQLALGQKVAPKTVESFINQASFDDLDFYLKELSKLTHNLPTESLEIITETIKNKREEAIREKQNHTEVTALTTHYLDCIESLAGHGHAIPQSSLMLYQAYMTLPEYDNVARPFNEKSAKVVDQIQNLELKTFNLLDRYHNFKQVHGAEMNKNWARIIEFKQNNPSLHWTTSMKLSTYGKLFWYQVKRFFTETLPGYFKRDNHLSDVASEASVKSEIREDLDASFTRATQLLRQAHNNQNEEFKENEEDTIQTTPEDFGYDSVYRSSDSDTFNTTNTLLERPKARKGPKVIVSKGHENTRSIDFSESNSPSTTSQSAKEHMTRLRKNFSRESDLSDDKSNQSTHQSITLK